MENNLTLYEKVRQIPMAAQRAIAGGRLKGMTDINPMWRIKVLTENFGICGIGWKAPIKRLWTEAGANAEIIAFCEIELFIKVDGKWSDAITGTGGNRLVAKEKNGLYTSDECYKMAYTDALGVACKMLGIGADVYWEKDDTKYTNIKPAEEQPLTKDELLEIFKTQKTDLATLANFYNCEEENLTRDMLQASFDYKTKKITLDELTAYKEAL